MAVTGITVRAVGALKPGETIWDANQREAVRGFGVRRQRGHPLTWSSTACSISNASSLSARMDRLGLLRGLAKRPSGCSACR
jgi:hypothetical protein